MLLGSDAGGFYRTAVQTLRGGEAGSDQVPRSLFGEGLPARRLRDRGSPAPGGLEVGDLRSARWRGRETSPQRSAWSRNLWEVFRGFFLRARAYFSPPSCTSPDGPSSPDHASSPLSFVSRMARSCTCTAFSASPESKRALASVSAIAPTFPPDFSSAHEPFRPRTGSVSHSAWPRSLGRQSTRRSC